MKRHMCLFYSTYILKIRYIPFNITTKNKIHFLYFANNIRHLYDIYML